MKRFSFVPGVLLVFALVTAPVVGAEKARVVDSFLDDAIRARHGLEYPPEVQPVKKEPMQDVYSLLLKDGQRMEVKLLSVKPEGLRAMDDSGVFLIEAERLSEGAQRFFAHSGMRVKAVEPRPVVNPLAKMDYVLRAQHGLSYPPEVQPVAREGQEDVYSLLLMDGRRWEVKLVGVASDGLRAMDESGSFLIGTELLSEGAQRFFAHSGMRVKVVETNLLASPLETEAQKAQRRYLEALEVLKRQRLATEQATRAHAEARARGLYMEQTLEAIEQQRMREQRKREELEMQLQTEALQRIAKELEYRRRWRQFN